MSAQIHAVAIITPAAGKESRVREILMNLAHHVKEHEKGVAKYHLFEQVKDGNVFVVEEIYEDQAAKDAHYKTDFFTSLGQTIQQEGLLGAPLDIKTIKPIGGFVSR